MAVRTHGNFKMLPHWQTRLPVARTDWLSVRIMRLSGIASHDAGGLLFQWSGTIKSPWMSIKSPWVCTVTSRRPSPHSACPRTVKQSFITHLPLVSSTGAVVVTVLWPVPFPQCAPSNCKVTQTPHTFYIHCALLSAISRGITRFATCCIVHLTWFTF